MSKFTIYGDASDEDVYIAEKNFEKNGEDVDYDVFKDGFVSGPITSASDDLSDLANKYKKGCKVYGGRND